LERETLTVDQQFQHNLDIAQIKGMAIKPTIAMLRAAFNIE
jgi:hypothetical protein